MSLIALAVFLTLALIATSVQSLAQRLRETRARRAAAFEGFAAGQGLSPYRLQHGNQRFSA